MIATIFTMLLFIFSPKEIRPGVLTRWEVIEIIEKETLYQLTSSSIAALENCKHISIDEMLEHCFPQDRYSRYRSLEEHRDFLKSRAEKVFEHSILAENVGYFRLYRFTDTEEVRLVKDINSSLELLKVTGIEKIVIDLRDNPGGSVLVALDFISLFAPMPDTLMITERSRGGLVVPGREWRAKLRGSHAHMKIAVLVNENTASAAELATGVLQRWGAVVFGTGTVGKSEILNTYLVSTGGFVTLTVRRYYFADGSTVRRGAGISPDVIVTADSKKKRDEYAFTQAYKYLRSANGLR